MDTEKIEQSESSPQEMTEELPKTEEAATEPEPSPKKKLTNRAIAGIVAGVAAVAIVAGAGIYAVANPAQEAAPAAEPAEQVQADTEVQFAIDAPDWNQDSSAAIAHIAGKTYEGDDVDFYHAFQPAEEAHAVTLASGDYEVEWVTPINSDGSLYKVPEKKELKVPTVDEPEAANDEPATEPDPVKSDASMEKVPADQVSADDLNKALDQIGEAVAKGDGTLTGDAGTAVADKAAENASKNPNADKGAVEEKKQQAEQKADEAKPSESKADTGTKTDSGSTSGASQSDQTPQASTHTHNWVYHEAQYTTKHHEAQYKTVHHDAVTKTQGYSYCVTCFNRGTLVKYPDEDHLYNHAVKNENDATKHKSETVVVKAAYDEQVLVKSAYDEQVLTKAAYYSCSCGATK